MYFIVSVQIALRQVEQHQYAIGVHGHYLRIRSIEVCARLDCCTRATMTQIA